MSMIGVFGTMSVVRYVLVDVVLLKRTDFFGIVICPVCVTIGGVLLQCG